MSHPTKHPRPVSEQSFKKRVYERLSGRKALIALTILPVVLIYLLVLVFPIVWAIAAGFHDINTISPEWHWSGLSNYASILTDSFFHYTLWLSFLFAAGSIVIQTVFGVVFALILNSTVKFQKVASAILFLPFLVPTAIVGFVLMWMGNSSYGIFNWILVDAGILDSPRAWFGNADLALPSIIVANSWKYIALVTIMVYARLQSVPSELYETARMMGASSWQMFRDITIPNIKGVVFIVTLLNGIWMFFKFDLIWILTEGGPGDATTISVIYAYEEAFQANALGRAAAMSVLLFIIVVVGAIIYFRVFEPEQEVRVE
ncbi:carbohydrate ABC transporter permease [Natronococcus roseus]|uniref:carbohydrate ABC transporter permease n=1 Tax=Natronococcus roseus TaxID=1052014 RepID=UPI00374DE253